MNGLAVDQLPFFIVDREAAGILSIGLCGGGGRRFAGGLAGGGDYNVIGRGFRLRLASLRVRGLGLLGGGGSGRCGHGAEVEYLRLRRICTLRGFLRGTATTADTPCHQSDDEARDHSGTDGEPGGRAIGRAGRFGCGVRPEFVDRSSRTLAYWLGLGLDFELGWRRRHRFNALGLGF